MYDINEALTVTNLKVTHLISVLRDLPQDADVVLCGNTTFFIHVKNDKSIVNIDIDALNEQYPDGYNPTADIL